MHTDEYEISLFRELDVCRNEISRIKKSLHVLEKKYNITTEEFAEGFINGKFSSGNRDFFEWNLNNGLLKKWLERLRNYEEILHRMKI